MASSENIIIAVENHLVKKNRKKRKEKKRALLEAVTNFFSKSIFRGERHPPHINGY